MERSGIIIGQHLEYSTCRFCLKSSLTPVVEFGPTPLAGGFLKTKRQFSVEKLYPLTVVYCSNCGLVQAKEVVDKTKLFKKYFYRSGSIGTLVKYFEDFSRELKKLLTPAKNKFVVEIGSNDGVLLQPLMKRGFKVLGVDPAQNVVGDISKSGPPTLCDYFGEKSANKILKKNGAADAIVSFHSLAHIDDMHDVMRGVVQLLKPEGILCVETHYLGDLISGMQFDMIYHEHHSYYTLQSLSYLMKMYDLELFDAIRSDARGGSMRYYAQFKKSGTRKISLRLSKQRRLEKLQGLNNHKSYQGFAAKIKKTKSTLVDLINALRAKGKSVAGYGASGRGTIVMSYCGLSSRHLDYVIDDAPSKQGSFTPSNHLPVVSSEVLTSVNPPDYCVAFAWPFIDELVKRNPEYIKNGGRFIVPLPQVKIVP